MKKRIALEDKNEWYFEPSESVIYFNDRKVYPEVKSLTFLKIEEKDCGLEFDLSEIALPNLEEIMIINVAPGEEWVEPAILTKKLSKESFCNVKTLSIAEYENIVEFQDWVSYCKNLESIQLNIPKNDFIPFELSDVNKISGITIEESNLKKIPDFVFNCKQLEKLDFHRCPHIREISDDIKLLTNLKSYWHWNSDFNYVSPELFKLPKLEDLNLHSTSYKNPPAEIYEAIKDLKQRKPFFKYSSQGGNWFREIWDQV